MRIAIASCHVPFIVGGATRIVDDLARCLQEAGHQTDVVWIPVWETWREIPGQLLAMRLFDLGAWCDRLVTIRTPSHLLLHHDKHMWFLHHHRGAYDMWGTPYQDIPDTPEGRRVRDMIHHSDACGFEEAQRIFAVSPTAQARLRTFSGVTADVLYPPLFDAHTYRCDPAERFMVYPSRITTAKRQVLAVEAMAHVTSDVRLVIAGPPDDDAALVAVHEAIERYDVADRVTLEARWISEEAKQDLLARSLACLFIPFDEDYGYVGLEACYSSKPTITCTDSGGVLGLVQDGETGYVVPPRPETIADAIDRLAANPGQAAQMGRAARDRPDQLGIEWSRVAEAFSS